jgi:hypothetical protein
MFRISIGMVFLAALCHAVSLPVILQESGALGGAREFTKPVKAGEVLSVNFAVKPAGDASIRIQSASGAMLVSKQLHAGDGDFTTLVSPDSAGSLRVTIAGNAGAFELKILRWPANAAVKRERKIRWVSRIGTRSNSPKRSRSWCSFRSS